MKEQFHIFSIACTVLIILIIAWTGFSVFSLYDSRLEEERNHFLSFSNALNSLYHDDDITITEIVHSSTFSEIIHSFITVNPRLNVFLLYSNKNEVQYFYTKNSSFFEISSLSPEINRSDIRIPVNNPFERIFLNTTEKENNVFHAEGLYTIIDRTDILLLFQQFLFLSLILLIIIIFVILLFPLYANKNHRKDNFSGEQETTVIKSENYYGTECKVDDEYPVDTHETHTDHTTTLVKSPERLFSPASGLVWEDIFEERLQNELDRASSFDQDLVLCLFCFKNCQDRLVYKRIASNLISFFLYRDLLFEFGNNGFSLILPNIDLDQGLKKIESFMNSIRKNADLPNSVSSNAGLSSRNGRLMRASRLIKEAEASLSKAKRLENGYIMGFRSNPIKFRNLIADTLSES